MAIRRAFSLALVLAASLAFAGTAGAQTKISVAGAAIRVSDIDPGAAPELADIELGRAPPPGSSRLLSRKEVRLRLREAGVDPARVSVPESMRVESPSERWKPEEVAVRADAAVRAALPPGVALVKLSAKQGVVVPPGTTVASASPVIPRRVGRHELTLVAELRRDEEVVARAPLSLVVEVSAEAFAPVVHKGDRVTLVVQHGNAKVGATAVALADADQGDAIWFKVTSTGKTLKAKVASSELGVVVEL
jgi:hypothetical protein